MSVLRTNRAAQAFVTVVFAAVRLPFRHSRIRETVLGKK